MRDFTHTARQTAFDLDGIGCVPEGLPIREQERRRAILQGIARRIAREGAHCACPHEARARQFMPFVALRGYSDMVAEAGLEDGTAPGLVH